MFLTLNVNLNCLFILILNIYINIFLLLNLFYLVVMLSLCPLVSSSSCLRAIYFFFCFCTIFQTKFAKPTLRVMDWCYFNSSSNYKLLNHRARRWALQLRLIEKGVFPPWTLLPAKHLILK